MVSTSSLVSADLGEILLPLVQAHFLRRILEYAWIYGNDQNLSVAGANRKKLELE